MTWVTNSYRFGPASGLPPSVAATHWRLIPVGCEPGAGSVTWPVVATIEMAETPAGPDVCSGGTVISSGGWNSSHLASVAFDGNPASYAQFVNIGISGGGWLGYAFAAAKVIREIRMSAWSSPDAMFRAVVPQYSLDAGASWVSLEMIGPLAAWSASEQRVIPQLTAMPKTRSTAVIWGVTLTSPGGAEVAEIEFRASAGGVNLCTGGVSFGTAETNGSVNIGNAYNGTNVGRWLANTPMSAHYVFPSPPNPSHIAVKSQASGGVTATAQSFDVWWSEDGLTRNTVLSVAGQTGWIANETRVFAIP